MSSCKFLSVLFVSTLVGVSSVGFVNPNATSHSGLKIIRPGEQEDKKSSPSTDTEKTRKIDPAALPILDQAQESYKNLKCADLSGEFSVSVKTEGIAHSVVRTFSSSFERPNKFRHQMKPNILLGCDGKSGYAFDEQENTYLRFEYSSNHIKLPGGVLSLLLVQNPSLLFAMSGAPILDVMEDFGDVRKVDDHNVNGTSCPTLQFGKEEDENRVQIVFDPQTHLIRQFLLNIKSTFTQGDEEVPGTADISVDYKTISPDPHFPAEHFAWSPPADAEDLLESAGSE